MRSLRLLPFALLLWAAPSLATTFEVLGWTAGHVVSVTFNGVNRNVLAAQFRENLDGVIGTSFCADLAQVIGKATYTDFVEYDPAAAEGASFANGRKFVLAAQIVDAWSNKLGWLESKLGVTQADAITGIQLAVWEAVYGSAFAVNFMTLGTQSVYSHVLGANYSSYGSTVLLYSRNKQDQLFTPPIPEPSAMIVFGAGVLLVGRALARRSKA